MDIQAVEDTCKLAKLELMDEFAGIAGGGTGFIVAPLRLSCMEIGHGNSPPENSRRLCQTNHRVQIIPEVLIRDEYVVLVDRLVATHPLISSVRVDAGPYTLPVINLEWIRNAASGILFACFPAPVIVGRHNRLKIEGVACEDGEDDSKPSGLMFARSRPDIREWSSIPQTDERQVDDRLTKIEKKIEKLEKKKPVTKDERVNALLESL